MSNKLRNMTSIYISRGTELLMLYRIGSRVVVSPSWCGIGGHFEEFELNDPYGCVIRELQEETAIKKEDICNVRLKYITLRLKKGEVRQNYYFFADLKPGVEPELQCNEGKLQWVDYDKVFEKDMPYTAKQVLKHFFEEGIKDERLYGGIAKEDKVVFEELKEF